VYLKQEKKKPVRKKKTKMTPSYSGVARRSRGEDAQDLQGQVRCLRRWLVLVALLAVLGAVLGILFILQNQGQINIGSPLAIRTLAANIAALDWFTFISDVQLIAAIQTLNWSTVFTEEQIISAIQAVNISDALPPIVFLGTFAPGDMTFGFSGSSQVSENTILSVPLATPSYGRQWLVWVYYASSLQMAGDSVWMGVEVAGPSGSTYFAPSFAASNTTLSIPISGSGYSLLSFAPNTNIVVSWNMQVMGNSTLRVCASQTGNVNTPCIMQVAAVRVS